LANSEENDRKCGSHPHGSLVHFKMETNKNKFGQHNPRKMLEFEEELKPSTTSFATGIRI
jgi:hypothetical protein